MTNIFTLENTEDFTEKINIDELYEKKRIYHLNQLEIFNKILHRIHVRIKTTSRQKIDDQFCWFIVPEIIIGVPKYDQGTCIVYIMDKLKDNGFNVRYIQPNTLFISWSHLVPSYVRNEIKKQKGIIINEYGIQLPDIVDTDRIDIPFIEPVKNEIKKTDNNNFNKSKKDYTPINAYKPLGNLIYNDDLINTIENKFR